MSYSGRPGVKLDAFAKIIRRESERYPAEKISAFNGSPYTAALGDRIGASGLMSTAAAKRRIWAILNPEYKNRKGETIRQELVDLDTADKILTALDLTYLWHTELRDAVVMPTCQKCGLETMEEDYTPGCTACHERRHRRKKAESARRVYARNKCALADRPGSGGLSAVAFTGAGTDEGSTAGPTPPGPAATSKERQAA